MDPFRAELDEFIRRLRLNDDRANLLGRKAYALSQGIRDLAADGGGGVKACVTTITGTIVGGDTAATALPGSQLRIVGDTTGTAYGTFVITSGVFTLDLILNPAETALNLYATGPGVRFAESAAQLKSVTKCASNALGSITTKPATGFQFSLLCPFPIKNTLAFDDAILGTGTVTGTSGWTNTCATGTSFAVGACPSVNGIWRLTMSPANLSIAWFARSGGGCVVAATCTDPMGGTVPHGQNFTIASKTCPDETTLFEVNFNVTERDFHGPTAQTLRIYEELPL